MSAPGLRASPGSSDFWSVSDHSTECFQSWPGSETESTAERAELDLFASETLSISDGSSTATPTFSDVPGTTQGIGEQITDEEVAKKLDFGPGAVSVVSYSSSTIQSFGQDTKVSAVHKGTPLCAATVDSSTTLSPDQGDRGLAGHEDPDLCATPDSTSSSDNELLLGTVASAKPTCRRRAALDSDSDSDQPQCNLPSHSPSQPLQTQLSSAYDFMIPGECSSSDDALCDDSWVRGTSARHKAVPLPLLSPHDQLHRRPRSVIVLDSSDDDSDSTAAAGKGSIKRLSSDAAAQNSKASQKENLSPDQLASRLHTLQIAPGTAVKPPQQLQPRQAQSLPPKPKQRPLPSTPLTVNKAKAPADFKRRREALAYELFHQLNAAVFGGRLPAELQISWNVHLKTTAGLTHYSRVTLAGSPPQYTARVELSTKVLDSPEKLQRTLCHELCHVATWLLDHVAKPPHGPHFKAWAAAAMRVHPHLDITTCHQYDIHFAWRWQCSNPGCQQMYQRHSNSIDITKQVCSSCTGKLQALGRFNTDGTPAKVRPPSQYSLFVKENFATHKQKCGPGTPHREVMQALSASWKARAVTSVAHAADVIADDHDISDPMVTLSFLEA